MVVVVALVSVALCLPSGREDVKCILGGYELKKVPDYNSVLGGSYTMILEVSSVTDKTTVYVTEVHERHIYHDVFSDVVGVMLEVNGSSVVYQYYPEKNVFVEEYNEECHEVAEPPTFPWGWWDTDPKHGSNSFGPSSILRLASNITTELVGEATLDEGIMVTHYKGCSEDGSVELNFYYSRPPWDMPEENYFITEDSLPVRMEVAYADGFKHWTYKFVDFTPFVRTHSLLEPPRGMACEAITGIVDIGPVPIIPKHFSLAEEVLLNSLIDGVDFGYQYLESVQMTYAGEISLVSVLATLPYDNWAHTAFAVKVIHDFNTGVQYMIFKEFGNCSRDFIPEFAFDTHFGGFLGAGDTLLAPNEMFHLDDKFAFVGERMSRDIIGDLWTSTRNDIPDISTGGMQNYEKAVLEYYFLKDPERLPSGEFTFTDLPFRGDLFIYNKSNPKEVVGTVTTNFFDFREVNLFSPEEFSVEECFERYDDDWSYMDIFFPAKKNNQLTAAAEEQTRFKHEVMLKMIKIGRLSPVRIASIDVSTGTSGVIPNTTNADMVIATVKLLERAPYIYSYRQPPDETDPVPGVNQKVFNNLMRIEDCATICSLDTPLNCKSFHHCDDSCYFSQLEGPDGEPVEGLDGHCEHWVFDLQNQTVEDYPSEMVYKEVFEAIKHGDFIFDVPYKNNTVQVGYEANMMLHYRTPDPLDPIRMQFMLENRLMTVADPDDTIAVADLTECMVLCVGWLRYRCETIIHQRDEGLCLLLSRHYHELNQTELVPHTHSYIHGRSYLVDYNPILGGVALNSTGPTYSPVEHLETCARHCSVETSITCQSFEYCPSNQICHLHAEHFLDVVDDGDYTTGTACIHFSRKTDSDFTKYEDQGLTPSLHWVVARFTSSEACAKMCIEDANEVCQSYDFCAKCNNNNVGVCGEENVNGTGLCFLATHHLGESGLSLTTAKGCDHYDRTTFGNQDYASWIAGQKEPGKSYTGGAMTGLAFGMIFLGILLAVGFLVAITTFRPASVPKDFELSFTKLKTSGESDI